MNDDDSHKSRGHGDESADNGKTRPTTRGCVYGYLVRGRAVERRVLPENRLLESADRGTGLDAELIDEGAAPFAVDLERCRLLPAAIEREHQLRAEALVERMRAHEPLELRQDFGVAAERERSVDTVPHCSQPQTLEPPDRLVDERRVAQVPQRRAAPLRERAVELSERRRKLLVAQGLATGVDGAREAIRVDVTLTDAELVRVVACYERAFGQHASKSHHAVLDDLRGARRRLSPERVDHRPRLHRFVGVEDEKCQHGPLGPGAEVDHLAVADNAHRAENAVVDHRPRLNVAPALHRQQRRLPDDDRCAAQHDHRRTAR